MEIEFEGNNLCCLMSIVQSPIDWEGTEDIGVKCMELTGKVSVINLLHLFPCVPFLFLELNSETDPYPPKPKPHNTIFGKRHTGLAPLFDIEVK